MTMVPSATDFNQMSLKDRDSALLYLIDQLSQVTELLLDRLETLEKQVGYNSDEEYC